MMLLTFLSFIIIRDQKEYCLSYSVSRIRNYYYFDSFLFVRVTYLDQDERYAKYIGRQAIVPLTFGRHVPIIADRVRTSNPFLILSILTM